MFPDENAEYVGFVPPSENWTDEDDELVARLPSAKRGAKSGFGSVVNVHA